MYISYNLCTNSLSFSSSQFVTFLFFCSDSEEEPARKSKKSPKEKQKNTKPEPPPKKDPVQYVSETGNGLPPAVTGAAWI